MKENQIDLETVINGAEKAAVETETNTEVHAGPHIPTIQGEQLGYGISNTVVTTVVFALIVMFLTFVGNRALKSNKKSKFKTGLLSFFKFFDEYLRGVFEKKEVARMYFPLIVGIFVIIFFGNLFGLAIDWFGISVYPSILHYLRPMHSDLNTTLVLATITVVSFLAVGIKSHGTTNTLKGYFFNFFGKTITEKCVNVFVGWLHFIGVPATLASLSLRLFGNIFAGIVLISVITYLGSWMTSSFFEVGRFLSVPFWFFEFFVAFVQSVVFGALIISYINQAKESH